MAWISRMRALLRRDKLAKELQEEMEFHLTQRAAWNREHGMAAEDARRDARRRFGSVVRWRERMSEIDGMTLPQTIWQDVRYGARMLSRNAGFTIAAVLALALGIGVNTTAFTAYKVFLGRSIEARDASRLVNLALNHESHGASSQISYPDYVAYRDGLHSFSGILAESGDRLTLTGAGGVRTEPTLAGVLVSRLGLISSGASDAESVSTLMVSENYFSVLGVSAIRGRTFEAMSKEELAASPGVMITENYWQKRFGGDASIVGKSIRLNDAAFTVIGITPHDFTGTALAAPAFWFPLSLEPLVHPGDNWLRDREEECCRMIARLAPGVTMEQAQAEMSTLAERLRGLHDPHSQLSKPVTAELMAGSPFPRKLDEGLKFAILLIMLAVGMVLVIACANVASLQLARAASRQNELSMRLSLGASRARLIRQLLTESALLGLIAGIVAMLFSWMLMHICATIAAEAIPVEYGTLVLHVTPDLVVFTYVFGISLLAGVLFGLAPALESSRSALSSAMKANAGTSPQRGGRLRDGLIALQVCVSLVLLIAGSLLIRSSIHSLKMDTGYEGKKVINLEIQFPSGPKYTAAREAVMVGELRRRLGALPGVGAITSARPPDGGGVRTALVSLNGEKPSEGNSRAWLYYVYVQPNYFETLSIPMLSGRGFAARGAERNVVVVSETAAKHLWPGENPIGHKLRLGTENQFHNKGEMLPDGVAYEVIGVARDTRGVELDGSDAEEVYVPMGEGQLQDHPILIRTLGDSGELQKLIGPVVASIDPNLVATSLTLDQLLQQTPQFVISSLAAAFASTVGLLGLLLASMGIYGTISYIVVLRTREVGIRMALGAKKRDVLVLMLRQCARPVVAGLAAGMVLAVGAAYLLRGVLFGLNALDGVSFAGVSLLLLGIALLAAYLPSRRAMRVDPVVALRYE